MPVFKCENCGTIDNTALGHYWSKNRPEWFDWTNIEDRKGKALCCTCAPTKFSDGTKNKDAGMWHNKFEKQHIDDFLKKYPDAKDEIINL